jgi:hypothetical protein
LESVELLAENEGSLSTERERSLLALGWWPVCDRKELLWSCEESNFERESSKSDGPPDVLASTERGSGLDLIPAAEVPAVA